MSSPVHGPKPIDLRRSKRRWAFALARFGAVMLGLLVVLHLLFLFLDAGQSPAWHHGIAVLATLLPGGAGGGWGIAGGLAGWIYVLLAFGCAVALWTVASRAAALVFLGAVLWEAWARIRELGMLPTDGSVNPTMAYFGALVAFLALFIALLTLVGTVFADRSGAGGVDGRRLG